MIRDRGRSSSGGKVLPDTRSKVLVIVVSVSAHPELESPSGVIPVREVCVAQSAAWRHLLPAGPCWRPRIAGA